MIRTGLSIDITPLHNGAAVRFPPDAPLIAAFRARFPKACWGGGTRSWLVPGKLAAKRLALWADENLAYVRALELSARDREWDEAAPAPPGAYRAPAVGDKPSNRQVIWRAIPGQGGLDFRPPEAEPGKAVAAIVMLDGRLARRELFGFLRRRFKGHYDGFPWPLREDLNYARPQLVLWAAASEVHAHRSDIHVRWSWTAICGGDGWAEYGWLPDSSFFALQAPEMVWATINPDKRYIL